MTRNTIVALLAVVAGTAGAEEARVKVASCNKVGIGYCAEYRNNTKQAVGYMKDACDQRLGHVWSEQKGCPTENRIAHCKRELLGSVTQANYYPPATMKKATDECAALVMPLEKN